MAFNRSNDTLALTPDTHGAVYFRPLTEASTALQSEVTTQISTTSAKYRLPVVTATPVGEWTAEGADIALSDPGTTEVSVTPPKLATLSKMSRELIDDSGSDALGLVQTGMISNLARKIDEAYFGAPTSPEAPAGLRDLVGIQEVDLTGEFANIDAFSEALSLAENVGVRTTAFVASPATVLKLSTLKEGTGSNRPLLTPDVTVPGRRSIQGVTLFSNQYVEEGVVWAIPNVAAYSIVRTPAELAFSEHGAAFTSYSVLARLVQRIGFLHPHPAAIVRITESAGQ